MWEITGPLKQANENQREKRTAKYHSTQIFYSDSIKRFWTFLGWMADSKSEEENIQNGPVTSCCTRIQTTQRTMSCFFYYNTFTQSLSMAKDRTNCLSRI